MAVDKLVDSTQLDSDLTSVANAIRTKGGTSGSLSFPSGFVSAIQNIPSGGGGGTVTKSDVNFYDYDGTLVASKTKTEINAMTSDSDLPANPTHTGLTAQGWNWTVAQLKAQLTAMPDQPVNVGQMYVTTSGKTEIDVVMPEGRLNPTMTIAVNGEVSVDWGDNTTPDAVTGTSLVTRLAVGPHTYSAPGSYTIKITSISGNFVFYCTSTYTILLKNETANENRVYSNCIKAIRLGNGITSISNNAFYYCSSLLSITIPSSVTSIGSSVFYYCYSLSSATIPSGVTSIGNSAFRSCYSISSIMIPSSVTSMGNSIFYACYSLPSITIPSSVTSIPSNAFSYCSSLSNIMIPSNVTSISSNAFSYCSSLSNITIPSSVTSIGSSVFYSCYSLLSVTIPSSITSISGSAFGYCSSLSSIIIPSDVTSIGDSAFTSCYSLSSITVPSKVTNIGNTAFQNCYGMKEYHFLSAAPPTLLTTVFSNITSDCIIYVPSTSVETYKGASNWSNYTSYIQGESA